MNVEAIIWTVVFFGGVILILTFLLFKAMQADREEARKARARIKPARRMSKLCCLAHSYSLVLVVRGSRRGRRVLGPDCLTSAVVRMDPDLPRKRR